MRSLLDSRAAALARLACLAVAAALPGGLARADSAVARENTLAAQLPAAELQGKMFNAIVQNDGDSVRDYLRIGANPNMLNAAGFSTLEVAVSTKSGAAVEALIQGGADLQRRGKHQASLLVYAVAAQSPEMLELLLAKGMDPNVRDDYGNSPLMIATIKCGPDCMRVLLEHGAWTYPVNAGGTSALGWAQKKQTGTLLAAEEELLRKHGAPADSRNRPLDEEYLAAVEHGDLDKVKSLLAAGADLNAWHCVPVMDRCVMVSVLDLAVKSPETMEYLIARGANVQARSDADFTPLHQAAAQGTPATIELLVRHGADVNARSVAGHTPLFNAVNMNHPSNVEALLRLGANPNPPIPVPNESMLGFARRPPRSPLIAAMLEKAGAQAEPPAIAPVNDCPSRAPEVPGCELGFYIRNGDVDGVTRTLDRGVDPSVHDESGTPALVLALRLPANRMEMPPGRQDDASLRRLVDGKVKIARLLLDRGADVSVNSGSEQSPLQLAALDARLADLVGIIVKKGVPVDETAGLEAREAETPLQRAVDNRNAAGAAALLDAGANPDLPLPRNITPLLAACMMGDTATAAVLLKHGAKTEIAQTNGRTPLKAAVEAGNAELVALLLRAGADPANDAGSAPSPADMAQSKGDAIRGLFAKK